MVFKGEACLKKNYIGLGLGMMAKVHSFSLIYVRIECIIAIMGKSYIYLMGETLVDELVSFLTSQGYKVSSSGQLRGDGYYQKDTIISW